MTPDNDVRQQAIAWARDLADQAVRQFIDLGILDSPFLEARPAWCHPPGVLIAMLREQGARHHSFWLICGPAVHFDYIASSAAASAREAARHFAMKWHLEAARLRESTAASENPDSDAAQDQAGLSAQLEIQAESLFRLINDDALWR